MLPTFEEAEVLLQNRDEWNRIIHDEKQPIFQFLNREFVDALARYLKGRKKSLRSRKIVLEVGAGSGLLSEELRGRGVNIVATDIGVFVEPVAPVEFLSYSEALRRFRPNIVLCSWMPYQRDWTPEFRRFRCVKEYILIGEHGGCCGGNQTWIRYPGFEKVSLDDVSQWAICRTDFPGNPSQSSAVSFSRRDK